MKSVQFIFGQHKLKVFQSGLCRRRLRNVLVSRFNLQLLVWLMLKFSPQISISVFIDVCLEIPPSPLLYLLRLVLDGLMGAGAPPPLSDRYPEHHRTPGRHKTAF